MTALTILEETERLLLTKGWAQLDKCGCVLDRMFEAAGLKFGHNNEKTHKDLHAAATALRRHLGVQHLTLWNDASDRDLDDVIRALAGARKLLVEAK